MLVKEYDNKEVVKILEEFRVKQKNLSVVQKSRETSGVFGGVDEGE